MAEYIEREALLARLNKVCVKDDVFGMGIQSGIEHAINCTNEAPAADVVEVVRCDTCTEYGKCPICYFHLKSSNSFCSNGKRKDGAKMDGKGEVE